MQHSGFRFKTKMFYEVWIPLKLLNTASYCEWKEFPWNRDSVCDWIFHVFILLQPWNTIGRKQWMVFIERSETKTQWLIGTCSALESNGLQRQRNWNCRRTKSFHLDLFHDYLIRSISISLTGFTIVPLFWFVGVSDINRSGNLLLNLDGSIRCE